ncbi:hypothetical protein AVEN_107377-1 [Araneus ventricosus]|uniref:Uncharacterized protein n=1 Tax=Araneus ventricosus TaxID=182803 RepID=A0A4Y2PQ63_ARAVE|nr:hypothetical protein AVEN_107377-1 [Araneus ventricosus]
MENLQILFDGVCIEDTCSCNESVRTGHAPTVEIYYNAHTSIAIDVTLGADTPEIQRLCRAIPNFLGSQRHLPEHGSSIIVPLNSMRCQRLEKLTEHVLGSSRCFEFVLRDPLEGRGANF